MINKIHNILITSIRINLFTNICHKMMSTLKKRFKQYTLISILYFIKTQHPGLQQYTLAHITQNTSMSMYYYKVT